MKDKRMIERESATPLRHLFNWSTVRASITAKIRPTVPRTMQ
uniref:Uncharacterized protein n=1 Tax=Anguilla anguilla TaxID=7936 RepID=A0A0E9XTN3_ANGAN